MRSDQIGGAIAIVVGILSILEAVRLYPYGMSPWVGDHTMPALLGFLMVILGMVLIVKAKAFQVETQDKQARMKMLYSMGTMLLYGLLMPHLGYLISTCIGAILLFKIFGSYKWITCMLYGGGLTASLYVIFILWLNMPFPAGFFS